MDGSPPQTTHALEERFEADGIYYVCTCGCGFRLKKIKERGEHAWVDMRLALWRYFRGPRPHHSS